MPKTVTSSPRLTLEGGMTIYTAAEQKGRLLEALTGVEELDLDLSQVGEMDSAGFQLLIMAKRAAQAAGKTVRLTAHSKAVTELLDLYNMGGYFGDPMVIPAHEQDARKAVKPPKAHKEPKAHKAIGKKNKHKNR